MQNKTVNYPISVQISRIWSNIIRCSTFVDQNHNQWCCDTAGDLSSSLFCKGATFLRHESVASKASPCLLGYLKVFPPWGKVFSLTSQSGEGALSKEVLSFSFSNSVHILINIKAASFLVCIFKFL